MGQDPSWGTDGCVPSPVLVQSKPRFFKIHFILLFYYFQVFQVISSLKVFQLKFSEHVYISRAWHVLLSSLLELILQVKLNGKQPLARRRSRNEDKIKFGLMEMSCEDEEWMIRAKWWLLCYCYLTLSFSEQRSTTTTTTLTIVFLLRFTL
jgi:hypothetical protein